MSGESQNVSPNARRPVSVNEATFVSSAAEARMLPAPLFAELAFAGKSNVGKSSLLNCLLARRNLVRVSQTPGCTRTLNLYRAVIGERTLHLVDLPGYGYAKRSKRERSGWGEMIEGYLEQRAGLVAVVIIVDVRRGLGEDDVQLIEFLRHIGREAMLVATKLDKLSKSERKPLLARLQRDAGVRVYGFSAVSGEGRDGLWRALLKQAAQ